MCLTNVPRIYSFMKSVLCKDLSICPSKKFSLMYKKEDMDFCNKQKNLPISYTINENNYMTLIPWLPSLSRPPLEVST